MLLRLILRMPRRQRAWKPCNGFIFRLHVGFFLAAIHGALKTAFYVRMRGKASAIPPKNGKSSSQVLPHMSADDVAARAESSHMFQRRNRRKVISLMAKDCRVYGDTDKSQIPKNGGRLLFFCIVQNEDVPGCVPDERRASSRIWVIILKNEIMI